MIDTMYYNELSWKDMEEAIKEEYIVILPIGSTEQHGPHLPICTDDLMAQRWAQESARMVIDRYSARVLVMPGIHYGNASHHMAFPGTVTLSFETLKNITFEVADSVLTHGFRKLVILNVHGGNRYAVRAAAVDLATRYAKVKPTVFIRVAEDCDADLNPLIHDADALAPYTEEARIRTMVHSGALETAKMLYLLPGRVRMERAREIDIPYRPSTPEVTTYEAKTPYGAMGRPREATAEVGRIMWEALVRYLAEYLRVLDQKK